MGAKIISLVSILIMFSTSFSMIAKSENRPPEVDLGEDITAFVGEEIDFTKNLQVSDPDDDELEYSWDFDASVDEDNDGNKTNDKEWNVIAIVVHTYDKPGNYTVTLWVSDKQHNVSDQMIVRVKEKPGESDKLYKVEDKISQTKEIKEEGFIAYEIELKKAERLKISIKVIKGPKVYIYLFGNNTTYQKYRKGDINIYNYEKGSKKEVSSASYKWKAPKDGVFYLVVDNHYFISYGTNGTAKCNINIEKLGKETPGFEMIVTTLAIFAAIVIIGVRKKLNIIK